MNKNVKAIPKPTVKKSKRAGKGSGKEITNHALRDKDLIPTGLEQSMRKMGRPSTYTQDLADLICERAAMGMSARRNMTPEDMPALSTFFKWLREHEDFSQQYARAKEEATEAMSEDLLDIADDGSNDYMEDEYMKGKTPGWALNGENIQRSKLRVDTRRWLMAKMKPRKYGDKLDLSTNGKDMPTPILGIMSVPNVIDDMKQNVIEGEVSE